MTCIDETMRQSGLKTAFLCGGQDQFTLNRRENRFLHDSGMSNGINDPTRTESVSGQ